MSLLKHHGDRKSNIVRNFMIRKQTITIFISAGIYMFVFSSIMTNHFHTTLTSVLSNKRNSFLLPFGTWNGQNNDTVNQIYEPSGSHFALKSFRYLFKYFYNKYPAGIGKDDHRNKDKYLIYRCDNDAMSHCGGITDRLKGIMTAYILANLTGRTLKVDISSHHCNFGDYFVPNRVDWNLPTPFHKTLKNSSDVVISDKVNNNGFYMSVKYVDFNSYWPKEAKYIYFKANLDYMDGFKASTKHGNELYWMQGLTRDQINSAVFRHLIKLSPRLQSKMDIFLKRALPNRDDKLVCAHVRMGRNPSIPGDYIVRNRPYVLPRVWDFLTLWAAKPNHKIFFTSDSEQVVQWAKTNISSDILLIKGEIHHIERTEGVSDERICRAQEKAVLEQFVLMHCDVLMISKSGFSRLAAYVRGNNDDLHCLAGTDVIPCQLQSLKELYSEIG